MKKIVSILLCLLVSATVFSQGQAEPDNLLKPQQVGKFLVNDYTSTLTEEQRLALEDKLVAFDDSTTTQIAVVIIPTLNDKDIADYGVELFRAWGIGTKQHNNGVLLLIAKDDHKLNITTGYGLEGALPDLTCKEIIDQIIVPKFKGDDYYRGIDNGIDAIMMSVKGEYSSPDGGDNTTSQSYPLWEIVLFWVIGIIVLLILIKTGLIWPVLNIAFNIVLSSGGSSSGGGFGGFGGGSSGGGGASGSW